LQVKKGGRLIITCDVPALPLELVERLVGEQLQPSYGIILDGMSALYKTSEFKDYNIILLDLIKD